VLFGLGDGIILNTRPAQFPPILALRERLISFEKNIFRHFSNVLIATLMLQLEPIEGIKKGITAIDSLLFSQLRRRQKHGYIISISNFGASVA